MDDEATCTHCKQTKSTDLFGKTKSGKPKARCRACASQATLDWYYRNRERVREKRRQYTYDWNHDRIETKGIVGRKPKKIIDGKTQCSVCKQWKPTIIHKSRLQSACRECFNTHRRERYHRDAEYRERTLESTQKYHDKLKTQKRQTKKAPDS